MSVGTIIKGAWTVVKTFTVVNAPMIGLVATVVGVAATGYLAWKQGQKAKKIIEVAEENKGAPLTMGEKLKFTWKQIAVVLASIILTCGSACAGYFIQEARLQEAIATSQILMASNKELQEQIKDISEVSPDVVKDVQDKHLHDMAKRTLETYDDNEVYRTGHGNQLFFDGFLGTKFYSSPASVAAGIARFQKRFETSNDGVTIDDLYECLDILKEGTATLSLGWFKAAKMDYDKYDIPDITVSKQTFYEEDRFSGELTDDYDELYVINYFPHCFSGKYVLTKDNMYRKKDPIDPTDLMNFV